METSDLFSGTDWDNAFANCRCRPLSTITSTITSAVLDRLLHHCQSVVLEGSSYRMKDRLEK